MKRRIICALLVVSLLLTCVPVVSAKEESTLKTYQISACTTDGMGLPALFMVSSSDTTVYIRGDDFKRLLCDVYGFAYQLSYEDCAFTHNKTGYTIMFEFDSRDVRAFYCGKEVVYTAPAKTLFVDDTCWIPFYFALGLFGGTASPGENEVVVDLSGFSSLLAITEAFLSWDQLMFSWLGDVGYSEMNLAVMKGSGRVVNFLDGMLKFEASSWGTMLSFGLSDSYEKKFQEEIAPAFVKTCMPDEDDEASLKLEAGVSDYKAVYDVIYSWYKNGRDLSELVNMLTMGNVTKFCYELLKDDALKGNKTVKNLKKDFKKWEKLLGGKKGYVAKMSEKLKGNGYLSVFDMLSYGFMLADYYVRFCQKSDYAVEALKTYSIAAGDSYFVAYAINQENMLAATIIQTLIDNMDTIIGNAISFGSLLGAPAQGLLFLYNVLSETLYKQGLEAINRFERINYTVKYQHKAYLLSRQQTAKTFVNGTIKEKNLQDLFYETYSYLRFSYICHEEAITYISSLELKNDPYGGRKDAIISHLRETRNEICALLITLEQNKQGLLPSQCKKTMYSTEDGELLAFLQEKGIAINQVQHEIKPILDTTNAITAEEACELCRSIYQAPYMSFINGSYTAVYGEYWNSFTYEVLDTFYYEDGKTGVYVISENGSTENYYYVPFNGEEVWYAFAGPEEDYVYSSFNLLEFSIGDVISLVGEMGADVMDLINQLVELEAKNREGAQAGSAG